MASAVCHMHTAIDRHVLAYIFHHYRMTFMLTLTVLVTTVDALGHFETG